MQRIDKIYHFFVEQPHEFSATAQEIADIFNITRANASNDLNQLVKQERLIKNGTKPVRFSLIQKTPTDFFDIFVQKNTSLKNALDQAKAAVLYPPKRMDILLSGETGVGKSMFAELIYRFSVQERRIDRSAKLLTFNCADYANNPQLILGQLFGVAEGSYTGATQSKNGLIEEADGGILFLDEVHRLPPEAQEMLFTFMDKKVFHRLGETIFRRTADVQLICATTEDISSSLLQTFTRRIPMKIHLPSLDERGMEERLNLITTFFTDEVHNLNRQIQLSMNTLRALLSYKCPSNIGQLKTDIQLLCAQGYARSISSNRNSLIITSYDLPPYIKEGLYTAEKRSELWKLIPSDTNRFVEFSTEQQPLFEFSTEDAKDIYQLIDHKVTDMEKIGLNAKASQEIIDMTINDFFNSLKSHTTEKNENIIHLVGNEIYATAKRFLDVAAFAVADSENLTVGLALHLYNLLQRIKNGQKIVNPKLGEIQQVYKEYYESVKQHVDIIENSLAIQLPEDEIGFLTLFIIPQPKDERNSRVQVIVVAHGETTASSMADVVNKLLGNTEVIGFNMPITCQTKSILSEIEAYIKQIQKENVLILTDMGSLNTFASELEKNLDIHAQCVDLVSTLHVLEASRKAKLGYSLQEIATDIRKITHMDLKTQTNSQSMNRTKNFLVTACTTGSGSAKMIKNLLDKQLNLYDGTTEIRSFQITNSSQLAKELAELKQEGNILCYISSFKIEDLHCPYFDLTKAFDAESLNRIQQLIDFDEISNLTIQDVAPMFQTVDGTILLRNLKEWISNIEADLHLFIPIERKIGLLYHLASVIDNLKLQEGLTVPEAITYQTVEESTIYHSLHSLELIYGVHFSQTNFEHVLAYVLNQSLG